MNVPLQKFTTTSNPIQSAKARHLKRLLYVINHKLHVEYIFGTKKQNKTKKTYSTWGKKQNILISLTSNNDLCKHIQNKIEGQQLDQHNAMTSMCTMNGNMTDF